MDAFVTQLATEDDAQLRAALNDYVAELPDFRQFLEQRGVAIPAGVDVSVEIAAEKKDPIDKCFKLCYKGVCVVYCT